MVGWRMIALALLAMAVTAERVWSAEGPARGFDPPRLDGVMADGSVTSSGLQAYRYGRGHDWPALRFETQRALDWSRAGALAIDVENPGPTAFRLLLRLDDAVDANGDERSLSGVTTLKPHERVTLVLPLDGARPAGMVGPPPARLTARSGDQIVSELSGSVKLDRIRTLFVSGYRSDDDHVIRLGPPMLRDAEPGAPRPTALADAFGQWIAGEWPEKVKSLADLRAKLRDADAALRRLVPVQAADRFGGIGGGPVLKATGVFRTEKVGGRWTLVTPQGHRFFSLGVDTVAPQNPTIVAGRLELFQALPPEASRSRTFDFGTANLERGLGPDWRSRWPSHVIERLQGWGFNTLGTWSDPAVADLDRMAHVAFYDMDGDVARVPMNERRSLPDSFDPRFAGVADRVAAEMTRRHRADAALLGYFSGNELPWATDGQPEAGIAAHVLALGRDSPAKSAFIAALRARYGSVSAWAATWGRPLAGSWEDAAATSLTLPSPVTPAARDDIAAFEARFAEAYFRTVALAIKAHDPRHLYLGTRFASVTPAVVAACARWCDVISFNVYGASPEERAAAWRPFDKPVLIGEFHFGSTDRGLFWAGMVSAGREEDRGPAYAAYLDAAVSDPQIVGAHWFQYADEPLTGRPYDGENAHIGLVAVTDVPYSGFVTAVAAANRRALLRFGEAGVAELRGTAP